MAIDGKVIRWHQYHTHHAHTGTPEEFCAECEGSLSHTITIVVEDVSGVRHEIHADCKI
jgi:hypothetical protein